MRITNKVVTLAALGTAGLALVGVGASAEFSDEVTATAAISSGSLDLELASSSAGVSINGDAVQITNLTNTGSDFGKKAYTFSVTNAGSLTVNAVSGVLNVTPNGTIGSADKALADQISAQLTCAGIKLPAASLGQLNGSLPRTALPFPLKSKAAITCTLTLTGPDKGLTNEANGGSLFLSASLTAYENKA